MLATLILAAAVSTPATSLEVQPWVGTNLTTTTSTAVKYRLRVIGVPKATVRLGASGVANGWLAAFCTPTVCSPMHVDTTLPASGEATYQFELIREDPNAPKTSGARITSDDGGAVTIPPAAPR
jgi:hypothetical protein